jgi:hypothetical protein
MHWTCFFLGLLFVSCQSSSPWIVSHIQAGNATYDSSRLSYRFHDIVNEIGVEMICAQGFINTYLEVHTQEIPPYQGNHKEAFIVMKTADQTKQAIGYRHEGGQRVSLPADLQEELIHALHHNQTVTIVLEGFATTINPQNFTAQFKQLHAKPFANPFQLPFKL